MKIILIACGVGVLLILIAICNNLWIILPTESSPHTLTFVNYGGCYIDRVTIRHYVNEVHINDYVLELKIGVRYQHSQSYELPQLNEGMIEVNLELMDRADRNDGTITINYDKASDLYEKGLLIYTTTDYKSNIAIGDFAYYDQYVYFISGKEKTSYFEKAGSSEWSLTTDSPKLKKFTREEMGYSTFYYGWKENEWEVSPAKIK